MFGMTAKTYGSVSNDKFASPNQIRQLQIIKFIPLDR